MNDRRKGPVGPDGLTPRERMEALGFEIDEDGFTKELGHDISDPWDNPWKHHHKVKPDIELRCGSSSKGRRDPRVCQVLLARVWKAPREYFVVSWLGKGSPVAAGDSREQAIAAKEAGLLVGTAEEFADWMRRHDGEVFDRREWSGWLPDWCAPDGSIAVVCPKHGPARVDGDYVRLAADTPNRRFQLIDVTAGRIGYPRP